MFWMEKFAHGVDVPRPTLPLPSKVKYGVEDALMAELERAFVVVD